LKKNPVWKILKAKAGFLYGCIKIFRVLSIRWRKNKVAMSSGWKSEGHETGPWHPRQLLSLSCLKNYKQKDGPWPDLTRAYFWLAVNKGMGHLWPEDFLTQHDEIFLTQRKKLWIYEEIFQTQGRLTQPDPTQVKFLTETHRHKKLTVSIPQVFPQAYILKSMYEFKLSQKWSLNFTILAQRSWQMTRNQKIYMWCQKFLTNEFFTK